MTTLAGLGYLVAICLFILGLKLLEKAGYAVLEKRRL